MLDNIVIMKETARPFLFSPQDMHRLQRNIFRENENVFNLSTESMIRLLY